jgi:hypothetical protein
MSLYTALCAPYELQRQKEETKEKIFLALPFSGPSIGQNSKANL